jgi:ABC-type multidrug transport system fused ATPase/permease subunit
MFLGKQIKYFGMVIILIVGFVFVFNYLNSPVLAAEKSKDSNPIYNFIIAWLPWLVTIYLYIVFIGVAKRGVSQLERIASIIEKFGSTPKSVEHIEKDIDEKSMK